MKKTLLLSSLTAFCLLGAAQSASAQGVPVNGATYKMTHYGVVADGSAAGFGVPAGSPLCLDVNMNSTTAGATLGQWGDNTNDGQRFVFELQTDGSFKLRHFGTPMYVQTVGLVNTAGTRIEQNILRSTGDDSQRWFITDPNNNGRYKFTLKNSANGPGGVSQVLEIGGGSPAPGAPVNLFDDNGFEQAQRWVLSRIALATKKGAESGLWVQAYPNPLAAGQSLGLRVEAQRSGPAEVEVLDVLGHKVHSQAVTMRNGGNELKLTNQPLAAGLYLVQVRQGDSLQQTRVVQQ